MQDTKGTALITGASTGIGAIYADRLARRGYDLVLVARRRELLDELAAKIVAETGRAVRTIAADLTDERDLARVEAEVRESTTLTMLVNNAGVAAVSPIVDADSRAMAEIVSLNIGALVRLTHAAAPGLVARRGAIVNISSITAIAPEVLNGVYGGSKAFVLAFSQSLHHELAPHGVRVQVVLPGATATDLWARAGRPVELLPKQIVMSAEDMVDTALAAFDQGELVTIPALPDVAQWDTYERARVAMRPNLSLATPAARYTR
ncbi:SDR family NAD(P)-dependent oxidoreductase [Sandaracinus amylolyticus]|uniref:SDR family NAD(P)-dependent oxidoreductase n=1 Tax=Sandaracinus amylolyticus TaxID=927083 RepID=UPI001F1BECE1|nr:SDR family oxidoreductase [Sandaracinus amylolyticus]UJR79705.1 Short-chain dehydrogenase [Sandaracinus amylolyticus]